MALTKLNLAGGVTGTLPTSNYVDSGKILKVQSSSPTSDSNTTSSSFSTYHTDGYNPVASNSTLFVMVSFCYQIYGNSSTSNGTASINISSEESGVTERARQSMQNNSMGNSNTYYHEGSGSISAFWQHATSSTFDIHIRIATMGAGRLKMLTNESSNIINGVRMTIMEIGA